WIASHENYVACFDRNLRSGSDRHADVGGDECWRVVNTVAHHRHTLALPLQRFDVRRLVLRQHLREHGVDTEIAGNSLRHGARIAGHHHHFDPRFVQPPHRLGRLGTYGVCHRERRKCATSLDEIHHALAADSGFFRKSLEFGCGGHAETGEQVRTTDRKRVPIHYGAHTATWDRLERTRLRHRQPSLCCARHYGPRNRMLGVALHGGRESQC